MARKLKVTYTDGRVVEAEITYMWKVATERHFRQQGGVGEKNALEATAFMAWVALHKTGQESNDFEPWLEGVDDVDDVEEAGADEETDPTPTAPQPDSASS